MPISVGGGGEEGGVEGGEEGTEEHGGGTLMGVSASS